MEFLLTSDGETLVANVAKLLRHARREEVRVRGTPLVVGAPSRVTAWMVSRGATE